MDVMSGRMQIIHLHKLNIPHQSARPFARSRMIGRVVVVGFPPVHRHVSLPSLGVLGSI